MGIDEIFPDVAQALPKAYRVLRSLSGVATYHSHLGVRHPGAAYNTSLARVGQRLLNVLQFVHQFQTPERASPDEKDDFRDTLLEATDHLLDALMEHVDDCGTLLKSFFSPDDGAKSAAAYSLFKREVKSYRGHIGEIDNYLKHKQGRLRLLYFAWPTGSCLGYYVEGPIRDGEGLGPVQHIHHGGDTAFSFNRDIRLHICNIFAVGAGLANVLRDVCKVPPTQQVLEQESAAGPWAQVLRQASSLPLMFFPDEVSRPIPNVIVNEEKVHIEFPSRDASVKPPPLPCRIRAAWHGDGVTRTFKMPYYVPKRR